MSVQGQHLIMECHGAQARMDGDSLDTLMRDAALAAGATVIKSDFHRFGLYQGVTGVVMLAESHISVHTWPEHDYAAFDVFMCGECDPRVAAQVIQRADSKAHCNIQVFTRGIPTAASLA